MPKTGGISDPRKEAVGKDPLLLQCLQGMRGPLTGMQVWEPPWTFRFWGNQAVCHLGEQDLGEALRAGGVSSVCPPIHTYTLSHIINTPISVCQAWLWSGERNSDTIFIGQA